MRVLLTLGKPLIRFGMMGFSISYPKSMSKESFIVQLKTLKVYTRSLLALSGLEITERDLFNTQEECGKAAF